MLLYTKKEIIVKTILLNSDMESFNKEYSKEEQQPHQHHRGQPRDDPRHALALTVIPTCVTRARCALSLGLKQCCEHTYRHKQRARRPCMDKSRGPSLFCESTTFLSLRPQCMLCPCEARRTPYCLCSAADTWASCLTSQTCRRQQHPQQARQTP